MVLAQQVVVEPSGSDGYLWKISADFAPCGAPLTQSIQSGLWAIHENAQILCA